MDVITLAVAKALAKSYTDDQLETLGLSDMSYYFCSSGEYNSSTGVPTVGSPVATTFYIAPAVNNSGLFNMYVYKNSTWTLFHAFSLDLTNLPIDNTLTQTGEAADAKKVGDEITNLKDALDYVEDAIGCAKKTINKRSISSSGEIEASSDRKLVCYQVEAGVIITATGTFDLYGFFESEPDDSSQTYNDSRTIANAINNVVVPAGCKWIAIRQLINDSDVQISPKGKVIDSVTKLSKEVNTINTTLIDINAENIDIFSYKNIFIKGTVVEGKVRTASGTESASELYFISDYFRIDKNTGYIFSLDPAADLETRTYNAFLCFYDINYQYISGSTLQSGTTPITNTFTTPVNAVYASVSTRIIFEDAIQIEKGSAITSYEPPMSVIHSSAQLTAKNTPPVFYVDKNGGADFTSLVRAIDRAENFIGATIYVAPGTYDLIDELKDFYGDSYFDNISASSSERQGIQLKNRVHIIFSSRSKVTAKYTGSNQYVKQKFSAFNANELGFTLENMRLETANTRYCIHDERSVATDQYINVYKNCKMKQDNSANTDWLGRACIGGGLGTNGEVRVENCVFESVGAGQTTNTKYLVSYHNSSDSGNVGARSNVVITGNYIKDACSIKCSWYGNSEDITTFVISNNSIGAAIKIHAEGDNPELTQNIEVFEWNNVIRS